MTLAEYTVGMTQKGFLRGLGSQVWAVAEDIHNTRYFLITAGTRFMAVYRAFAKETANPHRAGRSNGPTAAGAPWPNRFAQY